MNISSQPVQDQARSFAATAMNALTLGYAEKFRSSILSEEAPPHGQLEDMRLSEMHRNLFDREFRNQLGGFVENQSVESEFGPLLQIQYTVAHASKFEIIFLQIPRLILEDAKQIPQLLQLVYVLRGKTVRVICSDLNGLPSPSFNGLKRLWEGEKESRRIKIDYIPLSYIEALEQGKADLANVLNLDLRATPKTSMAKGSHLDEALQAETREAHIFQSSSSPKTIRIFLASSEELRSDRDEFELYLRQLNDYLSEYALYLKINRWENFLDAMSQTRLQDEYNQAVRESDIFVSMFFTKTGKFTEEEFDVAHRRFGETGKPLIYTFFKDAPVDASRLGKEVMSLINFREKLTNLGHFYTSYKNIEHLKRQFRDQLDKLHQQGKLLK